MTGHEYPTMAEELRQWAEDIEENSVAHWLLTSAADGLDREARYHQALTRIAGLLRVEGALAARIARDALQGGGT